MLHMNNKMSGSKSLRMEMLKHNTQTQEAQEAPHKNCPIVEHSGEGMKICLAKVLQPSAETVYTGVKYEAIGPTAKS